MVRIDVASRGSGVTANVMASAHMAARIPKAVARAPASCVSPRRQARPRTPSQYPCKFFLAPHQAAWPGARAPEAANSCRASQTASACGAGLHNARDPFACRQTRSPALRDPAKRDRSGSGGRPPGSRSQRARSRKRRKNSARRSRRIRGQAHSEGRTRSTRPTTHFPVARRVAAGTAGANPR
jgi:hypothetical protein